MPVMRLVLLIVALLAGATAARAHATLVAAEPADGAMLSAAPALIRLRFNETITPLVVRFIDAAGRMREDAAVEANGDTLSIRPPADLGNGGITLSYRVVSEDGHPVGGALSFAIGEAAVRTGAVGVSWRDIAIYSMRLLFYAALLFGVGGAAIFAGSTAPTAVTQLRAVLIAAAVGAVASLGLHGLDLRDLAITGLADPAVWSFAVRSSAGVALLLAIAACALAWLSLAQSSRTLSWLAFAMLGVSFASSGHAAVAAPQALMRPAMSAHVVAAALLIAPLPFLAGFLRAGEFASRRLRALRVAARAAVALLFASGVVVAIVQVETFAALATTNYGRLLVVKLAFVAGAIALFIASRRVASPRARRRIARLQLAMVAAILAATAGWRFTLPPRAIVAPATLDMHIHTAAMMANVALTPGRAGMNSVRIDLLTGDFGALAARETTLVLTPAGGLIEPIERRARLTPDGAWIVEDLRIPFAGAWRLTVEALVSDFDKIAIADEVRIPP